MTKFTTLILTTTLITITHLALAVQPAPTPESEGSQHLLIRFADLDMSRPEGASVLLRRIQNAAKIVCSPLESKDPARFAMFQHCVADAMERAVTQIDRPALDAYYRGKVRGSNGRIEVASNNQKPAR
jgi:UrcA family protein